MRAVVRALLAADELGSPPYVASVGILVLAGLAAMSSVRQWRRRPTRVETSSAQPRAWWLALFVLGPVVICAAYVASYHLAMPVTRALIWPPIRAVEGWPDAWEFDAVWPLEELLAGTTVAALFMVAAGWLVGKARALSPLDGYWLANPVSIVVGHILCAVVFTAGYEFEHWNGTMWALRVLVLCPVYAWLFYAGAAPRSRGAA
jgi:hypothetical protein